MTTKRETILATLKTKLETMSGLNVYRNRVSAIKRAKSPAVSLESVQDTATFDVIPRISWTSRIRVLLIVRNAEPETNADAWVSDIHEKIMEDTTLSGLTVDIRPISFDYEMEEADVTIGYISMNFEVIFQTTQNDLTS
jgi:hypothetical protein